MACAGLAVVLAVCLTCGRASAEGARSTAKALESISADDLRQHVDALADDTFEGREAGSRGGRAAGIYLGRQFQKHRLRGAAAQGGYYQPFGAQYRNILGLLEGSDPKLQQEFILVGAHYDHVGYGNSQNSYGPTGHIHNGADDNASGTAGLLELIEAIALVEPRPRRSIVFALWDGEEKGLLGSQHWVANPTLPLEQVPIVINLDMIGRLRNNRLEVYGCRTGPGLRQLLSVHNSASGLALDFSWEMRNDSDHWSFFNRRIPILMLHTGLHEDYHRPSDDAEKVNGAGMQQVVRLLFALVYDLAERPELPRFREAARRESAAVQRERERPLPPLAGRLGLRWNGASDAAGGLQVVQVAPGSAAQRGGIVPGDRIVSFAGHQVRSGSQFRELVLAAESPVSLVVQRRGAPAPVQIELVLPGQPLKLGISWRVDDAEPGAVALSRVVPDSPAARAGLQVNDRIYEISGRTFSTGDEFAQWVAASPTPLELTVERRGQLRQVVVEPTGGNGP